MFGLARGMRTKLCWNTAHICLQTEHKNYKGIYFYFVYLLDIEVDFYEDPKCRRTASCKICQSYSYQLQFRMILRDLKYHTVKENHGEKWNTCWRVKYDARQACFRHRYLNYTQSYIIVFSYKLSMMSHQPKTYSFIGVARRDAGWNQKALIGRGLDYPAVALFFLAYQGESYRFSVLLTTEIICSFSKPVFDRNRTCSQSADRQPCAAVQGAKAVVSGELYIVDLESRSPM